MTTLITPKILEPLGFGRVDANVLSYLIDMKKTNSREIERACDLRQPEVCNSLKKLVNEGFVAYTKKKREGKGKGRPIHIYNIEGNILDLLDFKLKQKQKKLASDIKKLDEISKIIKHRQKEQSQKRAT